MSNIFNSNDKHQAYEPSHAMPDNYMNKLLNAEGHRIFYQDKNNFYTMFGGVTSSGLADYFAKTEKYSRMHNNAKIEFDSKVTERLYKEAYLPIVKNNKGKKINWEKNNLFTYTQKGKNSFEKDYNDKKITDEQIAESGTEIAREIASFNLRQIEYDINPIKDGVKQNNGTNIFDYSDKTKNTVGIMMHFNPNDRKEKDFKDAVAKGAPGDDNADIDKFVMTKSSGNLRRKLMTVIQPDTLEQINAIDNNKSDAERLYNQCIDTAIKNREKVNTCKDFAIEGVTPKKKQDKKQEPAKEDKKNNTSNNVINNNEQTRFDRFLNYIMDFTGLKKDNKNAITNSAGDNTNDGNANNNMQ